LRTPYSRGSHANLMAFIYFLMGFLRSRGVPSNRRAEGLGEIRGIAPQICIRMNLSKGGFDPVNTLSETTPVSEGVSAPATMLVVEDDPAIRRLIHAGLGEAAIRIVEASTASEGIELAARRKPDVILLDLGLPDGEGMGVLKAVRSWSSVPVIVVSAREQEDLKVAALEAGADDYVTK